MTDFKTFEDQLIADMRANDGKVLSGPLAGHPLLIMTSKGAKTGTPRRAILTYHRDGDDYIVAGTAGGAPTTPSWVHNVQADPDVNVEVDNKQLEASASSLVEGPERDRLWDDHVRALPWFVDYPAQTGRLIPMIRLTPARST